MRTELRTNTYNEVDQTITAPSAVETRRLHEVASRLIGQVIVVHAL